MTSKLFRVTALLVALTMMAAPVFAQPAPSVNARSSAPDKDGLDLEPVSVVDVWQMKGAVVGEIKGATGEADYIVLLNDPPLASYRGGINGLQATNPSSLGLTKLDARSTASQAYLAYLEGVQAQFISRVEANLGRSVEVLFHYKAALNGVALTLTPAEAAQVAVLPGVRMVQRSDIRYPTTDYGPAWIGAEGIWNGTTTGGLPGTQGEGVIVGILDTGLNLDHESFADIGGDGYDHTNPYGSGNYVGLCDSDPGTWVCNDKLIGYWIFTGETTEDTDGHGSHTGSTTAGNVVTATLDMSTDNPFVYTATISGVAPHANVIGYDVCLDDGGCPGVGSIAAIDQAILDGVDVINFSIGGGTSDPWGDSTSLAFLAAVDAGVTPVTSAGNAGPGASTVGSPGDSPWMMTVGASTHDRAWPNSLINMSGGDTTPPGDILGKGITVGYGPASIVYAGDFGDALCLNPFAGGTFSGEIVVCDRGTIARVQKGANVLAGGAGGLVLANTSAGQSVNSDTHTLPAVHIDSTNGDALRTWLASGSNHMATIDGATLDIDPANGDIMAAFSSRGPLVNTAMDIIKPDVTAPGVDILAAYRSGSGYVGAPDPWMDEYAVVSGTSMSSPHSAGAAALMKALHPNWSPAQIKSAIMSTAKTMGVLKEDGATPADWFDMGGGRVDLSMAGEAGLVFEETATGYADADPSMGGDPKTLNLASLGNAQCLISCSWTRVVSSTVGVTETWMTSGTSPSVTLTVEPAMFDLGPYSTQMITVTADVAGLPTGSWVFGEVTLTPSGSVAPAHLPVAVVPTTGVFPTLIEIDTRRDAGSQLEAGLQSIEITDLTIDAFGLTVGTQVVELLSEDPTNGDPYDNLNDGTTFFVTTSVGTGAKRLVAETFDSAAPDIDLFVGTGDTPSAATEVCSSTSPTANEYCNIDDPAAGTWWILVQNWSESASPPDTVTLSYASVEGDAGNMTVSGPASVPAGTLYDLRIFWDEPAMMSGDRWYGAFDIGSSASSPGDVGSVDVNLLRHPDDVTKTVSDMIPSVGMTLTYTITVQPNVTPVNLTYALTDTIPTGLTYVPGSVSASSGVVTVTGNTLVYSGTALSPSTASGTYNVTTSASDPSCDTGFGGYVNLADFGIFAQAGITGDTVAFTAFTSGDPITYFGQDYTGMSFTDDGFGIFDVATNYGGTPWVPQAIPDAALPNNVLAAYWHDFEIFYDAGLNHGVALAVAGAPGGVIVVEYDDIQLWGGSPSVMDFEIVVARAVDDSPGAYEIVYAYDNISSTPSTATIGWEGPAGVNGGALVNAGDPTGVISNGFMVCMDYAGPSFDPITITYQATVDQLGFFTNNVESLTDNPGDMTATTSVTVSTFGNQLYLPFAPRTD